MVLTETVATANYAPRTSLTGVIAARTLNNLSFRVGGRVAERLVDVGQHVDQGTVLARIDPQEQEFDLRSAQADLDAAQAQLTQAAAAFERQKTLLAQGYTTRRDYDAAEQASKVARAASMPLRARSPMQKRTFPSPNSRRVRQA
ncbi:biotin/lipoyl-binding protein [Mesorhizobium sp. M0306]|uniref:efflux RND transporter periplasmic adaptor subunit n=1 Tax=Mesorhizobium sp. M0306 TaxID=2956932 RepID=UPI00333A34BB